MGSTACGRSSAKGWRRKMSCKIILGIVSAARCKVKCGVAARRNLPLAVASSPRDQLRYKVSNTRGSESAARLRGAVPACYSAQDPTCSRRRESPATTAYLPNHEPDQAPAFCCRFKRGCEQCRSVHCDVIVAALQRLHHVRGKGCEVDRPGPRVVSAEQ